MKRKRGKRNIYYISPRSIVTTQYHRFSKANETLKDSFLPDFVIATNKLMLIRICNRHSNNLTSFDVLNDRKQLL